MGLIKKYVPLARAAGKYAQGWITGKRIPLYVGLFITQRCNLRCVYCFPDSPARQREKEFSLEEIFRIVDELHRMGTRYITLLGGEPLLRKDFSDIVDYITRKRIIAETGTNGYFTQRHIDSLKKLSIVCHSIDGSEEEHDRNRGKGSYRKAIESLDLCRASGIPVQLRAVFTKNNTGSLRFLLDLARSYGSRLGLAEQAVLKTRDAEYVMTPTELTGFWKRVKECKLEGLPVDKSLRLLDNIIGYPPDSPVDKVFRKNDELPAGYPYARCSLSRGYMFLDSDGMVYPCARLFGVFGKSIYGPGGIRAAWEYLAENDCLFCRQSIQDLKSYFFSHDRQALMAAAENFLGK